MDGRIPPARPAVSISRPGVEGQPSQPTRPAITDREKAELFCQSYARVSRLPKTKITDHPIKVEARGAAASTACCSGQRTAFCSPFSLQELRQAVAKLKPGRSPGTDSITNDMIHQLSPRAESEMLALINRSWSEGAVPSPWRIAEIVAIPKKGKPLTEPSSYRPISLLSCVGKLAERLVQQRLQHWLEAAGKMNPNQAGFRRGHSTLDQLVRVTQSIFDALEVPRTKHTRPQRAVLALLDFTAAYDRVWRDALWAKMGRLGVPGCAIRWIRALLSDRRARVRWGGATSKWRVFQEGLPQGSVLAPLLWLIYINDLTVAADDSTTASLFADDVAVLATADSLEKCAEKLQPVLDGIERWASTWKVKLSLPKCVMTTFTLDPKEVGCKVTPELRIGGVPLRIEKEPTFLGLKLDGQLTFAPHINALKQKMAKRRACLVALAGKSYGCHRRTLRIAYQSYIRSLFDYGASIYFNHAAPAVRERLEVEQRKCARVITGCIKLTGKHVLTAEADLPPLSVRAKELAGREYGRLTRLPPDDPARQLLELSPPPRLQYRAHLNWKRKKQEAEAAGEPVPPPPDEDAAGLQHRPCFRRVGRWVSEEAGLGGVPAAPLALYQGEPPWQQRDITVRFGLTLPQPTRRTDPPEQRKAAALEALALHPDPDLTIWSDGSAKDGTKNGGGGALLELHRENRKLECTVPAGVVCSSMKAELAAMAEALQCFLRLPEPSLSSIRTVLLCSDSLSGLQLLSRGPAAQDSALTQGIWALLHSAAAGGRAIALQWVPGHADIEGNEEADRLANLAVASSDQRRVPVDLACARIAIRHWTGQLTLDRARNHPHREPTPGHDDLDRWGQTTVSQLRSGYSPLVRATLHRIGLATSPLCGACGDQEEETVEHLLCECPAYITTRSRLWGPLPTLGEVLSGPAKLIVEFLTRVGRTTTPVDLPRPAAP